MPFWAEKTAEPFDTGSSNSCLLLALKERYLVPTVVVTVRNTCLSTLGVGT